MFRKKKHDGLGHFGGLWPSSGGESGRNLQKQGDQSPVSFEFPDFYPDSRLLLAQF